MSLARKAAEWKEWMLSGSASSPEPVPPSGDSTPCAAGGAAAAAQDSSSVRAAPDLDPEHPVVVFLNGIGLGRYAELLLRQGFDDIETLMEIEDPDLKDLGFPRGHALKLKKRLRELQLGQCAGPTDVGNGSGGGNATAADAAAPAATPVGAAPVAAALAAAAAPTPTAAAAQQRVLRAMQAPQRLPTAEMKSAVERSWDQVQALGKCAVAEILLKHLFRLSPASVQLFPTHVRAKYTDWTVDEAAFQGAVEESPALRRLFSKLVNAVGCAVAGLHDVRKLVPMLMQLGERHAGYGVTEAHWKIMGQALQLTLQDCLKEAYTQEVASAWATVYGFISSIMIEGFRSAMTFKGGFGEKPSGVWDDTVSTSQGSTITRDQSL